MSLCSYLVLISFWVVFQHLSFQLYYLEKDKISNEHPYESSTSEADHKINLLPKLRTSCFQFLGSIQGWLIHNSCRAVALSDILSNNNLNIWIKVFVTSPNENFYVEI
jgi:hypothetical protein